MGQIKHAAASSSETSGQDWPQLEEEWGGQGHSGVAEGSVQPGVLWDEVGSGGPSSPCRVWLKVPEKLGSLAQWVQHIPGGYLLIQGWKLFGAIWVLSRRKGMEREQERKWGQVRYLVLTDRPSPSSEGSVLMWEVGQLMSSHFRVTLHCIGTEWSRFS